MTSQYAANNSVKFPETYHGSIIRMYTDDVHTGYVRLIKEKDSSELHLSDLYELKGDETRYEPAVLSDGRITLFEDKY